MVKRNKMNVLLLDLCHKCSVDLNIDLCNDIHTTRLYLMYTHGLILLTFNKYVKCNSKIISICVD